jgi:hypothetical protein
LKRFPAERGVLRPLRAAEPRRSETRAAGGAALVARGRGIAHQHLDLVESDIELLGHDLRDRDVEPLAHVHLAEEGVHPTVGQHRDPRVELGGNKKGF